MVIIVNMRFWLACFHWSPCIFLQPYWVYPKTEERRCWVRKLANVPVKLPSGFSHEPNRSYTRSFVHLSAKPISKKLTIFQPSTENRYSKGGRHENHTFIVQTEGSSPVEVR